MDEDRAERIVFHNGHRMPTKAVGVLNPMIMGYEYNEDRNFVLSKAHHLAKTAKTGKMIQTDLPKTIKDESASLAKQAYQIKQK